MNYNKTVNFQYFVERLQDKSTNEYYDVDFSDDEEKYPLVELTLEVEGSAYFTEGRKSGPWERCFPDESDEEIISVTLDGKDFLSKLTKSEKDSILEKIVEEASSQEDEYDEDCCYDDGDF